MEAGSAELLYCMLLLLVANRTMVGLMSPVRLALANVVNA